MEKTTFAAGCFWGVQLDFDRMDGVISTVVGYMGGDMENPTYEDICGGRTGHAEVVEVCFDPGQVTYDQLLEHFWQFHNPTTLNRQGPDSGSQYRSALFYHSEEQREAAEKSRTECDGSELWPNPVVTEITRAGQFWPAEEYHQKYLEKRNITISCH
ncbi:Peptide-methionine (S)-S-oxide reductase MsrA [hydrothermal vent metagenome]|uniref:peptide-methionine (S)-S-oxide reductase n=1 Tax=hydrothermal vent metagenome TaxID=652676 RepID=A0A3B0SG63_9ZZZZ